MTAVLVYSTILCYNNNMCDNNSAAKNDGRFRKGERRSPATEFKPGQHWRSRKPYWDRDWLETEYTVKQRTAVEIAAEFGVGHTAIEFWLKKHGIATRTVKETRAIKHWGLAGEANGMYGKRGKESSNWKGGCTPERQAFYSSEEWIHAACEVWKRDQARCRRCGIKKSYSVPLHIHHIVSFAVKEKRADVDNLVLLCRDCHKFVHSRKNTDDVFIDRKEVQ